MFSCQHVKILVRFMRACFAIFDSLDSLDSGKFSSAELFLSEVLVHYFNDIDFCHKQNRVGCFPVVTFGPLKLCIVIQYVITITAYDWLSIPTPSEVEL